MRGCPRSAAPDSPSARERCASSAGADPAAPREPERPARSMARVEARPGSRSVLGALERALGPGAPAPRPGSRHARASSPPPTTSTARSGRWRARRRRSRLRHAGLPADRVRRGAALPTGSRSPHAHGGRRRGRPAGLRSSGHRDRERPELRRSADAPGRDQRAPAGGGWKPKRLNTVRPCGLPSRSRKARPSAGCLAAATTAPGYTIG